MKNQKILIALTCALFTTLASAHCPATFKAEKACMMFEDSVLYIYDQKVEHNGPYKDFEKAEILGVKTLKGEKLEFTKAARGVYKVTAAKEKTIVVEVSLDKKKQDIKVSHQ